MRVRDGPASCVNLEDFHGRTREVKQQDHTRFSKGFEFENQEMRLQCDRVDHQRIVALNGPSIIPDLV